VVVTLSRFGVGPRRPARVEILLGSPRFGALEERPRVIFNRWRLRVGLGQRRRLVVRTPAEPFELLLRVTPTFRPSAFGAVDRRVLGAQVAFRFQDEGRG